MHRVTNTKIICPVCGNSDATLFVRKNAHDVYQCQSCRLLFVWPIPGAPEHIYSHEYFEGAAGGFGYVNYREDKAAMKETFKRYLHELNARAGGRSRLLDVGAATGYFMAMARDDGWNVTGVEISDWAAEEGRTNGLDIKSGLLKDQTWKNESFDAVTFWDVFEHVPDPNQELDVVNRLLKPGGLLLMNLPDAGSLAARILGPRWHLLLPPEHLHYFNRSNLDILLKRHGFVVLKIGTIGKRFTVQYILNMLVRWQGGSAWRWLAEKSQGHSWGRWNIPIHLHDNFFVVVRKQ